MSGVCGHRGLVLSKTEESKDQANSAVVYEGGQRADVESGGQAIELLCMANSQRVDVGQGKRCHIESGGKVNSAVAYGGQGKRYHTSFLSYLESGGKADSFAVDAG